MRLLKINGNGDKIMNVKELKEQIKEIPDDIEIYIRCCHNPCGNIIEAGKADKSTYGFFGHNMPCIIIEPDIDDDEE
jgi:hypothetical protein